MFPNHLQQDLLTVLGTPCPKICFLPTLLNKTFKHFIQPPPVCILGAVLQFAIWNLMIHNKINLILLGSLGAGHLELRKGGVQTLEKYYIAPWAKLNCPVMLA